MKREKIMDELKKTCDKLVLNCSSPTKRQVYMSILMILDMPNAFSYLDAVTSLNILTDLGYSKEDAVKLYASLIA